MGQLTASVVKRGLLRDTIIAPHPSELLSRTRLEMLGELFVRCFRFVTPHLYSTLTRLDLINMPNIVKKNMRRIHTCVMLLIATISNKLLILCINCYCHHRHIT
jgi:Na+/serine symporter